MSGKQGSRWGGFLQQAVASVESRLDTILAEEDNPQPKGTPVLAPTDAGQKGPGSPQKRAENRSHNVSRSSSNTRPNDRLQERLAKAVVRSGSPKPSTSTPSTPALESRSNTPAGERLEEPRLSLDKDSGQGDAERTSQIELDESLPSQQDAAENPALTPSILISDPTETHSEISSAPSSSARPSLDLNRSQQIGSVPDAAVQPTEVTNDSDTVASKEHKAALAQLQAEHEAAELRWQEELHGYVERMDAMQSKLLYLTKESSASANSAASKAPSGSLEKKLSEKNEKIALLMEEGQKLSKTELNHMTTIKKLRVQSSEVQKAQKDLRSQIEKAEREKQAANDRAKRAEAAAKRAEDQFASTSKSDRDVEALTYERNALNSTVADMRSQLARAISRAENAEAKAQTEALERERRQVLELKDDLSSQKIEHELREDKLRRELRELKDGLEREKEVSQALQIELRGEQTAMENKMESLRSRAEEVSSSGDPQAKLLRQIETLQTQYAVASENWQGIESSLLTRLARMEKERDDVVSREEDLRRKAREAGLKAKRLEADLEKEREKREDVDRSLLERQTEIDKLTRKIRQSAEELQEARKDFEKQQQTAEVAFSARLEEERLKWRDQSSSIHGLGLRTESPVASLRKYSGLEVSNLNAATISDRSNSRRPSIFPCQVIDTNTPPRQNSTSSVSRQPQHHPFETPSIQSFDHDDFFSRPHTPMSPPTANGVNDLISVSTVGAGPSVQLVERMSANVRRLESERAASKDEMTRLTAQRDEARQEVVNLMREVEEKRTADDRIKALEEESKKMDERYQASLEMLGEKSELVEELRADVADLKKIYRELVESTMK